jgi:hypothetical protein
MKAAKKRRLFGSSALDLLEEAVSLLRRAPASAHLLYYFGAIPFWLGFLYFISDMGQNAYAASQLGDWSLAAALLYVWKKCWQTVAVAHLRTVLSGKPDDPWTWRRTLRMVAEQCTLQPIGLLLRPIATVVTLPVVWVSAYFQNVTILGDGSEPATSLASRAAAQTKLWVAQAHGAVSIIYMFTFFVWINVFVALAAVPFLLKSFFGIDTIFSRSVEAYLNWTFLTATVALTSLVTDPLRKAYFLLRCFHGAALQSGEDIVAGLRPFRRRAASGAAILLAAFCLITATPDSLSAQAIEPSVKPTASAHAGELDRRIGEVLERREYAWRSPRQRAPEEKKGFIQQWIDDFGKKVDDSLRAGVRLLGKFFDWIFNRQAPKTPNVSGPDLDWVGLGKALLVIFGAALVGFFAWFIFRMLKQKRPIVAMAAAAVMPDLREENLVATQLPEDGWLRLAREYAARDELVLALRAAWLAGLAHLGDRELIAIARHKSNRDYERELRRRARDRELLLAAFDTNLGVFERSWYGNHDVSREAFTLFESNLERIRQL